MKHAMHQVVNFEWRNAIRNLARGLSILSVALVSGCTSRSNSTTEKINDRQIEFAMTRRRSVSVVFENGLGASMEC